MKTKPPVERRAGAGRTAPGAGLTAADIMKSPVVTLDKDTPLIEAARTLSEHRIGGAPVTDYGPAPLGVVSLFDIVSYLAGLDRPVEEPGGFYRYSYPSFEGEVDLWERDVQEREEVPPREIPVAEIMSPRIISVPGHLPVRQVARSLWRHHIHRIFVSRKGVLTGVISTMDVLRTMSRTGSATREGGRRRTGGNGHGD